MKVTAEEREKTELLGVAAAKAYRSAAARIGFIAQDRFDLMFASKECLRAMQAPTEVDLRQLKHIGRYLQ